MRTAAFPLASARFAFALIAGLAAGQAFAADTASAAKAQVYPTAAIDAQVGADVDYPSQIGPEGPASAGAVSIGSKDAARLQDVAATRPAAAR